MRTIDSVSNKNLAIGLRVISEKLIRLDSVVLLEAARRLEPREPGAVFVEHVIRAVLEERAHQDAKRGKDKPQSVPGFLMILEAELNEAKLGWIKNREGRDSVLHEIVQIAAVCFACLEKYGSTGCPHPTDDETI